jgi:hypothetical protein
VRWLGRADLASTTAVELALACWRLGGLAFSSAVAALAGLLAVVAMTAGGLALACWRLGGLAFSSAVAALAGLLAVVAMTAGGLALARFIARLLLTIRVAAARPLMHTHLVMLTCRLARVLTPLAIGLAPGAVVIFALLG